MFKIKLVVIGQTFDEASGGATQLKDMQNCVDPLVVTGQTFGEASGAATQLKHMQKRSPRGHVWNTKPGQNKCYQCHNYRNCQGIQENVLTSTSTQTNMIPKAFVPFLLAKDLPLGPPPEGSTAWLEQKSVGQTSITISSEEHSYST